MTDSTTDSSWPKATPKAVNTLNREPAKKKGARILVIDDHPIVRKGLVEMINQESDLEVCGEAANSAQAFVAIAKAQPDLIIADISLEGSSGIELIKNIRARFGDIPVLVLSMHDEALYAERALRAGSKGYIMKHEPTPKLMGAIRRVLTGQIYLSDAMATRMLGQFVGGAAGPGAVSPTERLSDRELEIFNLIGLGLGVRQIAEKLHLSVKTVETHREHIKEKLNLKSSRELLRFAVQSNLEETS